VWGKNDGAFVRENSSFSASLTVVADDEMMIEDEMMSDE
jgi:hypothetical protein